MYTFWLNDCLYYYEHTLKKACLIRLFGHSVWLADAWWVVESFFHEVMSEHQHYLACYGELDIFFVGRPSHQRSFDCRENIWRVFPRQYYHYKQAAPHSLRLIFQRWESLLQKDKHPKYTVWEQAFVENHPRIFCQEELFYLFEAEGYPSDKRFWVLRAPCRP